MKYIYFILIIFTLSMCNNNQKKLDQSVDTEEDIDTLLTDSISRIDSLRNFEGEINQTTNTDSLDILPLADLVDYPLQKALIKDSIVEKEPAYSWTDWFQSELRGNAYLTNYQLGRKISSENTAIAQDNDNVMMYANRKGVLTFDGKEWDIISTPTVPRSIVKEPLTGMMLVGCNKNFGYLMKDENGTYQYHSLSDDFEKEELGDFTNILFANNNIYFYSSKTVIRVGINNINNTKQWKPLDVRPYTGVIKHGNKIFVNIKSRGLYQLVKHGIWHVSRAQWFGGMKIMFCIQFDEKYSLIGTNHNKLYLFDGKKIYIFKVKSQEYLNESLITGGLNISATEFVISTLKGGCLIIDKRTGNTISTINYQRGLPDDEIYALGKDNNQGLWMTHEYGISRINYSVPVRTFESYPGLEGKVNSVSNFDSTLYVSTSEGLYYLAKEDNYSKLDKLVKVKPKSRKLNLKFDKKKKRNIFRKKKGKSSQTKTNDKKPNEETKTVSIYTLQSVDNVFKKVEGLDSKCKQMVKYGNRLLVATNTGLYEIMNKPTSKKKSNKAKKTTKKPEQEILETKIITPLIKDKYINHIASSLDSNRFHIATNEGLYTIYFYKKRWRKIPPQTRRFYEPVYSIFEDSLKNLWVGCEDGAYKLTLKGKKTTVTPYSIQSDFSERVIVRNINNKASFLMSSGIYSYDTEQDSVIFDRTLLKDSVIHDVNYIFMQDSITWINYKNKWSFVEKNFGIQKGYETYFSLFGGIQNICVDDNKNIWVVTSKNQLFKIFSKENAKPEPEFDLHIKSVSNDKGDKHPTSNLALEQENSSVKFKLSAPFFAKHDAVEYKYFIDGVTNNWSDWTSNPLIHFHFIPAGKHTLHVKARNIFGKEVENSKFNFFITPYWYETWWFYTIQASIFILLLAGSILINRTGKVTWLSKALTYVVVIVVFKLFNMAIIPYIREFAGGVPLFQISMSILLGLFLNPAEAVFKKLINRIGAKNNADKETDDNTQSTTNEEV